jgi:hypothetical protein
MLVSYGKMTEKQVNDIVAQFEALRGAEILRSNAAIKLFMVKANGEKIRMLDALKITKGYLVRAEEKLLSKVVR